MFLIVVTVVCSLLGFVGFVWLGFRLVVFGMFGLFGFNLWFACLRLICALVILFWGDEVWLLLVVLVWMYVLVICIM